MALIQINTIDTRDDDIVGYVCRREDEPDPDGGGERLGRRRSRGAAVLFASVSALETYKAEGRTDDANTALASQDETLVEETSILPPRTRKRGSKVKAVVAAGKVGTNAVDADVVLAGAGAKRPQPFGERIG